ncbi:MAG: bifunctional UDP-N-acetylglucosamine pyrophosphorylase/glucosamine-1-phosphate N-acetyltransferase [Cellvibrionaceae bacterium]|jgi:bifunctional UDP-N-acetylglucosamine pyrophosphorylase/glucosamine-1-phosphate N-acetyltransferase
MLDIVILAAGKGTRMKSDLAKVLHPIGSRSMLSHVVNTARELGDYPIHIITGYGEAQVKASLNQDESLQNVESRNLNYIQQIKQLGTGHAVQQALPALNNDSITLILYGDVPLINLTTLNKLVKRVNSKSLGLLTVTLKNPSGYGRIVRDIRGSVTSIVEQKDAAPEQLAIQEINTGIMAVNSAHLQSWLPTLSNGNAQGEYYLTDIIAMAVANDVAINTEQPEVEWEVMGINNRKQQAELERIYQANQADQQMANGVTLLDPTRFDCRGNLVCGGDVVIDVNCIFEGNNTVGANVTIGPNCIIKNTSIGDNSEIKANTVLEDTMIGNNCIIGPFARLRPGTTLAANAKIGNFVETKNAIIGEDSKVNHLSYVGDAILGKYVNIGAGTITCNYDGVNKHQTTIEDNVFVGSNTALVAPVRLGKGSTVGAGSTINKNVENETLAVTRSPQKTMKDWQRPKKQQ